MSNAAGALDGLKALEDEAIAAHKRVAEALEGCRLLLHGVIVERYHLTYQVTSLHARNGIVCAYGVRYYPNRLHYFQNAAYQYEAMILHMLRAAPDSDDTRRAIRSYEMEVERNRRVASDEAYKVAPFIHPRLAAIAVRGDLGHGDDIVQLMLDEIDKKNREHPMVIEHLPQKKSA